MSTSSRVRKSSPVKQGPMRATIPMASLLRHSGLRKSPTLSPTNTWRTRTSPDSSPSGQRSPGSLTYKAKSKTLSTSCDGTIPSTLIRRTASLDTIYLKGQWPRDIYLHSGLLQVDKATQTDECTARSRLASPCSSDDKLGLFRQRLQRRQASAECSSQTTSTPVNIPVKPMSKPPIRSSIEGLNQEIERLVLRPPGGEETTPEGHRAPVADLLRSTRSVNTQTPATTSPSPSLSPTPSSSPLIPCPLDPTEPGSQGSSPDAAAPRLGTSPHINRFLAREPPDGCERVSLRSMPGVDATQLQLNTAPSHTFQLKPSQGSAFHVIGGREIVPKDAA